MIARALVAGLIVLVAGCRGSDKPLRFAPIEAPPNSIEQFDTFRLKFRIDGVSGNPYDPDNIDVWLEITTPTGHLLKHPAFFVEDHAIVFEHEREVVRDLGSFHWSVRWTPVEEGDYSWKLFALHQGQKISRSGHLHCTPSQRPGFVRGSQVDSSFFETSDGKFFYPIGHVTRSPEDTRWQPLTFDGESTDSQSNTANASFKTGKYQRWFEQMHQAGENSCVIWMSPWWLGLEWSPTRPGYRGLGHYNQRHAAQLDRILQLAEENQIRVLLFTSNHGRYSTVIDREWYSNPHRRTDSGGLVDSPTEFFRSEACSQMERNRLRYIVARWGYSTALMGIGLCTEVGWIDPYHGFQSKPEATLVDGAATQKEPIHKERELVVEWFRSMSRFVRETDIHGHIVTLQFAKLEDGNEAWQHSEFDVVLNNAYSGQLTSELLVERGATAPEGIVDGFQAWSRYFDFQGKPRLVAEWGGHHLHNVRSCLASDLRTGVWALSMSELSGITGFWWCNEIDRSNLYPTFRAVHRFWENYDRRRKKLRSQLVNVSIALTNPLVQGESSPTFVVHPTRRATALANTSEGFVYVYHHHANTGHVPATNELLFPAEEEAWVSLPDSLPAGDYEVEFWDPGTGTMLGPPRLVHTQERRLSLPSFRIDLAVKLRSLKEPANKPQTFASSCRSTVVASWCERAGP